MTELEAIDIGRESILIMLKIAAPIMATALVVGLAIALFQALTSIQEMTLTFVPKVLCIVIVFWGTMGFMSQTLVSFFQSTLVPLIAGG